MAFTWQQQCGGRAACVDGRVLPVAAEQAIGAEAAAAAQKLCVAVVSIHEAARLARDGCDCAPTTARSSSLSVLTFSVLSWCWPRAASQMQRAFAIPDNNWKLRLYAHTHVVGCYSCVVCAQTLLSVLCTRMRLSASEAHLRGCCSQLLGQHLHTAQGRLVGSADHHHQRAQAVCALGPFAMGG